MTDLATAKHLLDRRKTAYNSTFAIGGFSCSADSLVVAESFVLRINISGKNPAHRKSAKRSSESLLVPPLRYGTSKTLARTFPGITSLVQARVKPSLNKEFVKSKNLL